MREKNTNRGAVTVDAQNQPKNDLNNRKMEKAIRHHPLIHGNIIISLMIVKVVNQIRA